MVSKQKIVHLVEEKQVSEDLAKIFSRIQKNNKLIKIYQLNLALLRRMIEELDALKK